MQHVNKCRSSDQRGQIVCFEPSQATCFPRFQSLITTLKYAQISQDKQLLALASYWRARHPLFNLTFCEDNKRQLKERRLVRHRKKKLLCDWIFQLCDYYWGYLLVIAAKIAPHTTELSGACERIFSFYSLHMNVGLLKKTKKTKNKKTRLSGGHTRGSDSHGDHMTFPPIRLSLNQNCGAAIL